MKIRHFYCTSAEELLDRLQFRHPMWDGAGHGDLGFRGHRQANWSLVPSAFRKTRLGYSTPKAAPDSNPVRQGRAEYSAVAEFVELADSIGLDLPHSNGLFNSTIRDDNILHDEFWRENWPSPQALETLAIAQHHGVPTRLLDFTYSPWVAALFAALGWINNTNLIRTMRRPPASRRLEIWVVDLRILRLARERSLDNPDRIREVRVTRATNPFLRAQEGFFLLDHGVSAEWEKLPGPRALDEVITERAAHWSKFVALWPHGKPPDHVITRLQAPAYCARDVLKLLHKEGKTRAHIMPSHDRVRESLEEQRSVG